LICVQRLGFFPYITFWNLVIIILMGVKALGILFLLSQGMNLGLFDLKSDGWLVELYE
jgi:hypothetical protein